MSKESITNTSLKRKEIKAILSNPIIGETVLIKGWVRAFRNNRFIVINDGSTPLTLQAVVNAEDYEEDFIKRISFHSCIAVTGTLEVSQGAGQDYEINVVEIEIFRRQRSLRICSSAQEADFGVLKGKGTS